MPSLITLIISIGIFFPINEKQIKSLNVFPRVGLERAQLAKIYKYLVKYWTALASIGHGTIRTYCDLISRIGTFDLKSGFWQSCKLAVGRTGTDLNV